MDFDDKYGLFMILLDLIWVWSYPISWNLSMLLDFLNLSPNLSVFIFVFVRILLLGGNMLAIPWYSIFFYVYLCSFSSSVSSLPESKMFGIPGTR